MNKNISFQKKYWIWMEGHWVYQPHSREGPISCKGWWPKIVICADTLWAQELRSDKNNNNKNLQAVRMVEVTDRSTYCEHQLVYTILRLQGNILSFGIFRHKSTLKSPGI